MDWNSDGREAKLLKSLYRADLDYGTPLALRKARDSQPLPPGQRHSAAAPEPSYQLSRIPNLSVRGS